MKHEDRPDAKQRLLMAGLRFFADKGFDGATVREICDEASSNIAAINYYFGDKKGFYLAVRDYAHGLRHEVMRRCWELSETDPWAALEMHVEILLDDTFDDTMAQINWLFWRDVLDEHLAEANGEKSQHEQDEQRQLYEARMTTLLTGILGTEAATPENISLLRYTYHSLCRFLPIQAHIEKKVLKGQGKFNVQASHSKQTLKGYIVGIVRHAVKQMQVKTKKAGQEQ